MNHFIRLLFILAPLFFLVSDTYACRCTKKNGLGLYCGGELSLTGGGIDCGTETLWNCNGLGKVADLMSSCVFGCCGITGINSFCCSEIGCPGCSEPYPPKFPQNQIPTTSATPNIPPPSIQTSSTTSIIPPLSIPTPSKSTPSISTSSTISVTSSPTTTPLPSGTPNIVIGTVSGIVGTALIMGIGVFGYKWNQRRRLNQDDIMRIPGNNIQNQDGILRIPGDTTEGKKTRIV